MAPKEISELKSLLMSLFGEKGLSIMRIVLFGSAARQDNKAESDLDLIVVSNDFSGQDIFARAQKTRGIHRALVRALHCPVDLIFLSEDEWQNSASPILESARREGVAI